MTEAPALGDPTLDADHAKLADLVDTGASDMGPAELQAEAAALADRHAAHDG